jgi:hypothetical protein
MSDRRANYTRGVVMVRTVNLCDGSGENAPQH